MVPHFLGDHNGSAIVFAFASPRIYFVYVYRRRCSNACARSINNDDNSWINTMSEHSMVHILTLGSGANVLTCAA